jgi:hypothetical protein
MRTNGVLTMIRRVAFALASGAEHHRFFKFEHYHATRTLDVKSVKTIASS